MQLSKKDSGVYGVSLRDERGKDKTLLDLTEAGRNLFLTLRIIRIMHQSFARDGVSEMLYPV